MQIRIQHHPMRKRHLKLLLYALQPNQEAIEIVEDDHSSASGMKKVFESATDDLLVLQDDILPCADFIETAKKIIEIQPDHVISFFSTRNAMNLDTRWFVSDRIYGMQAYYIPYHLHHSYLDFEEHIHPHVTVDDVRLSVFLDVLKEPVYIVSPNLVEHLCWDRSTASNESINRDNFLNRISGKYIGYENSGLAINWAFTKPHEIRYDGVLSRHLL